MPDERPWDRPLTEIFEIEPAGDAAFTTRLHGFGGVTLGCATLAAARTCEGRSLSSLHTYFLRPVPIDRPITLRVERLRDGRRFSHRRVELCENGQLFFEVIASFVAPGAGVEYQEARAVPVPAPDDLPAEEKIAHEEGWRRGEPGPLFGPLEWRWVDGTPWSKTMAGSPSRYYAWVRPRFPLPNDAAWNAAALAFLSDYHSHFPVARRLGGPFEPWGYTSLDQSLWVHRDIVWDTWLLLATESEVAHAGRALTRRQLFTADGRLVASMMQEQLMPDGG
jgi:acyl-CoA thioesterase-2